MFKRTSPYSSRVSRLAVALLCTVWLAAPAHAATFTVTATKDAPDAAPGDGLCASPAGDCTVRAAIEEANALAGADVVTLAAGKYRLTGGSLVISDDLTLSGVGTKSILSGNNARVLTVASPATVTIANVQIQKGTDKIGAGVYNTGALTLTNVTFKTNRAAGSGSGGGVYNDGILSMTDVSFSKNYATGLAGSFGGGLYNHGTAVLTRVSFTSNRAGGCGGAVYNTGTIVLSDVAMMRNRASASGGGLFNETGSVQLSDATISANQASMIGGGIFNYAEVALSNVTIDGNRAPEGGGVFNRYGTVTLTNVTISGNRAATGAGLYNDRVYDTGTALLKNTILANNQPQNCTSDPVTSLGHNVDSGTTCGFAAVGDRSSTDPMLGSLRDNGGFTLTRALQAGSPAIDAADDTDCPAIDQCGGARPADGNDDGVAVCDIGAFEVQPTASQ